jgi:glycosyltransferase involved in cell wall biosynthesis
MKSSHNENRISAVIITFNEERDIRRCLASLKDIVDEIVVIDSFSTDQTQQICLEYDVKFMTHTFEGYIEQKNFAMQQTSYNYVLSLDADECLDDNLRNELIKLRPILHLHSHYSFNRLNNYCGKWIKHCGWYPDRKIRLWDKTKGKWGGFNPHDTVVMTDKSKAKHVVGNILHYTYYTIDEHLLQNERFAKISAKAYFDRGKRTNLPLIYIKPIVKFLVDYFFRFGFLDGYFGFKICTITAKGKFIKYRELYRLGQEIKNKE